MSDHEFLVIGGGIGGLATALGLAHAGARVHVIEKAPEFGEIGAGLQLAPNASSALDRLGVLGEIRKFAVAPRRMVWGDAISGEIVTAFDLGEPFVARFGYPYLVMHRSDLLNVLLAACRAESRITLETGRDAVAIEDKVTGARVTCDDGTVYDCAALVGADGLWSPTRKFIADDGPPRTFPFVAYRGAIPIAEVSEHAGLDNVIMWCGPDMHFVQYPIRRGELFNQVAVFKSPSFPAADWGNEAELDAHYAQCCDYVRKSLLKIQRDRRWTMVDRAPISTWVRNRIALVGDAAHPMLQYIAQGACQAIEDTICLAERVRDIGDVGDAFLAYQEARYLRAARVQISAEFMGGIFHIGGVGRVLRNKFFEGHAADDYREIAWLYGHRA
ncbi:MAG TPA: FAD-dependent monooxygenase [Stellaceae bacterium]